MGRVRGEGGGRWRGNDSERQREKDLTLSFFFSLLFIFFFSSLRVPKFKEQQGTVSLRHLRELHKLNIITDGANSFQEALPAYINNSFGLYEI